MAAPDRRAPPTAATSACSNLTEMRLRLKGQHLQVTLLRWLMGGILAV